MWFCVEPQDKNTEQCEAALVEGGAQDLTPHHLVSPSPYMLSYSVVSSSLRPHEL